MNPELVVRGLSRRLTDDAMIAVDCGTATSWFARDLDLRLPAQIECVVIEQGADQFAAERSQQTASRAEKAELCPARTKE